MSQHGAPPGQEAPKCGLDSGTPRPPPHDENHHLIRVWDLGLRLFHWSLVAIVAFMIISGFFLYKTSLALHAAAGYAVMALLTFRVVWGVFGSEFSRFRSFLFPVGHSAAYLRDLVRGRQDHHLGHTPLAALMVFALLATLTALSVSGVVALGGEEQEGPLGRLAGMAAGDEAAILHALLAWGLVGLVAAHLMGVAVSSRLGEPRLVRAMLDGLKPASRGAAPPALRPGQPGRALAALLLCAAAVAAFLLWSGRLPPVPAPPALDPSYRGECGACHCAYYPSLLPAASWHTMMAGLTDHFGEDARLDPPQAAAIEAWLLAHAADAAESGSARRFLEVNPAKPLQITAAPPWLERHGRVEAGVFKRVKGGAGNCTACHGDAERGRFSYRKIQLPSEHAQ